MITNPWLSINLDNSPYLFENDMDFLEKHNKNSKPEFVYELTLRPEPYIGNLNSRIMLLALNPGVSPDDFVVHQEPEYIELHTLNLMQQQLKIPFYYLDPTLDCPGAVWWNAKLKWLVSEVGLEKVANNLCCLQFVSYHSQRYKHNTLPIPSQQFIRNVVKNHIELGFPIICLRSFRHWVRLVPELAEYQNVVRLRNPRNPTLSPKNMGESGFGYVVSELQKT